MPQQIKNNDDLVKKISELKLNRTGLSWDERDRGWKKLFDMAKDDHVMLEKIQMLNNFIYSKIPFAVNVPSWAKEGIDYMIIPNGTEYYCMDETKISKYLKDNPNKRNYVEWIKSGSWSVYDYEKEGLLPDGTKKAEWNGGAGMIFDGEYVLLTCNYRLYNETKKNVGATKDGLYNCFFNASQLSCFDDPDMDTKLRSIIINNSEDPYAYARTLFSKFYKTWLGDGYKVAVPAGNPEGFIATRNDLLNKLKKYDQTNEIKQVTAGLKPNNETPIFVASQKDVR